MIAMCFVCPIIDELRRIGPPAETPVWTNSHGLLFVVRPWVTDGQYKRFRDELRRYGSEAILRAIKAVGADGGAPYPGVQNDVLGLRQRLP